MQISKIDTTRLYLVLWIPLIAVYIWFFMNHNLSSSMGFITGSAVVYAAIGIYY